MPLRTNREPILSFERDEKPFTTEYFADKPVGYVSNVEAIKLVKAAFNVRLDEARSLVNNNFGWTTDRYIKLTDVVFLIAYVAREIGCEWMAPADYPTKNPGLAKVTLNYEVNELPKGSD